jgi:hypothetical protein
MCCLDLATVGLIIPCWGRVQSSVGDGDRDGGLDKVMRQLNLSATEKKVIKIGKDKGLADEIDDWHTVGKILTEKSISTETIQ